MVDPDDWRIELGATRRKARHPFVGGLVAETLESRGVELEKRLCELTVEHAGPLPDRTRADVPVHSERGVREETVRGGGWR